MPCCIWTFCRAQRPASAGWQMAGSWQTPDPPAFEGCDVNLLRDLRTRITAVLKIFCRRVVMISANDLLPPEIVESATESYVEGMAEVEEAAQELELEPWMVDRLKNSEREVTVNLAPA